MSPVLFILCSMIFCHIIADFNLQGILATMKQKSWWESQCKTEIEREFYKNDYEVSMLMHCFSWAFIVFIPVFIYNYLNNIDYDFLIPLFIVNIVIHFIVDDAKANKRTINLAEDQSVHMTQILFTWFFIYIF